MQAELKSKLRLLAAVLIIVIVAIILFREVLIGLTTSAWDVPLLTFLSFALWLAIYIFLSAFEESA